MNSEILKDIDASFFVQINPKIKITAFYKISVKKLQRKQDCCCGEIVTILLQCIFDLRT